MYVYAMSNSVYLVSKRIISRHDLDSKFLSKQLLIKDTAVAMEMSPAAGSAQIVFIC